jgi:hypothetical protein
MNQDWIPFIILGVTTFIGIVGWAIQQAIAKSAKLAIIDAHVSQLRDEVIADIKKDIAEIKDDVNAIKTQLTNHIIEETKDVTEATTKLDQIMKYIDRGD